MRHGSEKMEILDVATRKQWRAWLRKHYKSKPEIWLVYYKKHTGRSRIPYNDAVEEALCVGWIDSTVKGLDEDRFAQRFSPRNPKSRYSQANKERLRALAKQGRLMPHVLASVGALLAEEDEFVVPSDILEAIKGNPQAWKHFCGFSAAYIRIRVSFIDAARNRPQEFKKRLDYFIRMTEKGKQFGFGGVEKHY